MLTGSTCAYVVPRCFLSVLCRGLRGLLLCASFRLHRYALFARFLDRMAADEEATYVG